MECAFSISTAHGKRSVLGHACGLLGYYLAKPACYYITHLPTGLGILHVRSAREAREFIAKARQLDGDFTDPEQARPLVFNCNRVLGDMVGHRG